MKPRAELTVAEIDALQETLVRRLGDTSVPTLPHVALRILELFSDRNASMRDFGEVIRTDQALTGRILRVANSAAFAQRGGVHTLDRALVLLGIERVRAMALGFHLSEALSNTSANHRTLWTHSLFRAWMAFHTATATSTSTADGLAGEAFIIGLMLDVGIPLLPNLTGHDYHDAVNTDDSLLQQYRDECANLPVSHVDAAAALTTIWRFPERLAKPITHHHTRPARVDTDKPDSVLAAIAYFVGSFPITGPDANADDAGVRRLANEQLALDDPALEAVLISAREDFSASRELFAQLIDKSITPDQIFDRARACLDDDTAQHAPEDTPTAPSLAIRVDDILFELSPLPENTVRVFISEAAGKRLSEERITPTSMSRDQMLDTLLLRDAPPNRADEVLDAIQRLAA